MQGPHEMLACASLLGDLFPAAWPPSGAARPGQGSHAPPAHMRYRAALAKSFEPMTQEALRTLMACAAASDSLIFRAALVRLCARASGTSPLLNICTLFTSAIGHHWLTFATGNLTILREFDNPTSTQEMAGNGVQCPFSPLSW